MSNVVITCAVKLYSEASYRLTSNKLRLSGVIRGSVGHASLTAYTNNIQIIKMFMDYAKLNTVWIVRGEATLGAYVNENDRAKIHITMIIDFIREGFPMSTEGTISLPVSTNSAEALFFSREAPHTAEMELRILQHLQTLPKEKVTYSGGAKAQMIPSRLEEIVFHNRELAHLVLRQSSPLQPRTDLKPQAMEGIEGFALFNLEETSSELSRGSRQADSDNDDDSGENGHNWGSRILREHVRFSSSTMSEGSESFSGKRLLDGEVSYKDNAGEGPSNGKRSSTH
ncbi:uncharacterized protein BYT42DRAFT_564551 [Radiomyces spectabilis]|uniref:uncharacterized protein n=1 Tax=Radiomyces spectabilis TaxID=64574 RepID=UPI00222101BF|nr:uncharacterized protein BYT42DRAFT_564551 [Radiomyces spectabilis]KAI8385061.1 hypothetical protein BYT42DRAFT_564551 [Radiomyces spectabilis]